MRESKVVQLCHRCNDPATQSWDICALKNEVNWICKACDLKLNRLVLEFMKVKGINRILREYKQRLEGME